MKHHVSNKRQVIDYKCDTFECNTSVARTFLFETQFSDCDSPELILAWLTGLIRIATTMDRCIDARIAVCQRIGPDSRHLLFIERMKLRREYCRSKILAVASLHMFRRHNSPEYQHQCVNQWRAQEILRCRAAKAEFIQGMFARALERFLFPYIERSSTKRELIHFALFVALPHFLNRENVSFRVDDTFAFDLDDNARIHRTLSKMRISCANDQNGGDDDDDGSMMRMLLSDDISEEEAHSFADNLLQMCQNLDVVAMFYKYSQHHAKKC